GGPVAQRKAGNLLSELPPHPIPVGPRRRPLSQRRESLAVSRGKDNMTVPSGADLGSLHHRLPQPSHEDPRSLRRPETRATPKDQFPPLQATTDSPPPRTADVPPARTRAARGQRRPSGARAVRDAP